MNNWLFYAVFMALSPLWILMAFAVISLVILAFEWIKDPFFKKAKAEQERENQRSIKSYAFLDDLLEDEYAGINPDYIWGDK